MWGFTIHTPSHRDISCRDEKFVAVMQKTKIRLLAFFASSKSKIGLDAFPPLFPLCLVQVGIPLLLAQLSLFFFFLLVPSCLKPARRKGVEEPFAGSGVIVSRGRNGIFS